MSYHTFDQICKALRDRPLLRMHLCGDAISAPEIADALEALRMPLGVSVEDIQRALAVTAKTQNCGGGGTSDVMCAVLEDFVAHKVMLRDKPVDKPVDCRHVGTGQGVCDSCASGDYEHCRYAQPVSDPQAATDILMHADSVVSGVHFKDGKVRYYVNALGWVIKEHA